MFRRNAQFSNNDRNSRATPANVHFRTTTALSPQCRVSASKCHGSACPVASATASCQFTPPVPPRTHPMSMVPIFWTSPWFYPVPIPAPNSGSRPGLAAVGTRRRLLQPNSASRARYAAFGTRRCLLRIRSNSLCVAACSAYGQIPCTFDVPHTVYFFVQRLPRASPTRRPTPTSTRPSLPTASNPPA